MIFLIKDATTPTQISAPSLKWLAHNGEAELKKWELTKNIYITQGDTTIQGIGRLWIGQKYIPLDLDPVAPAIRLDYSRINEIIDIVCREFNIQKEKTWIVQSGSGVQFMIELERHITDKDEFTKFKKLYTNKCKQIEHKLAEIGIIVKADTSVFAANKLMRMPFTTNEKKARGASPCILLYGKELSPQGTLETLLGDPTETKEKSSTKKVAEVSTPLSIVKQECAFVKHFLSHPEEVHEPVYRAMIGILGSYGEQNITDFTAAVQSTSPSSVASYSEEQIYKKLDEVLIGTANVGNNKLHIDTLWEGCKTCQYFTKCTRPTSLETEAGSKLQGFWILPKSSKGSPVPNYPLLIKEYDKQHSYICTTSGDVYSFEQTHFTEKQGSEVKAWQYAIMKPSPCETQMNEFLNQLKVTKQKDPTDFFYNETEGRLNFLNGNLDTKTGVFTEGHSPTNGFRYTLPFNYSPDAQCPQFEKLLTEWLPDPLDQTALIEFFGYCIMGGRPEAAKVLILEGSGANGKSTAVNILKGLLGGGKTGLFTSLNHSAMMKPFNQAMFEHSLVNICEELPPFKESAFWECVKDWSSPGCTITADRKFKSSIVFENKMKQIMTTNALRASSEPTEGFFRRLLILTFSNTIAAENRIAGLDKLIVETEGAGVINKLVRGYMDLRNRGYQFKISQTAVNRLEEYKSETDSVRWWFEEFTSWDEKDDRFPIDSPETANDYQKNAACIPCALMDRMYYYYALCCENGRFKPVDRHRFGTRIAKLIHPKKIMRVGKSRFKAIEGLRFGG